MRIIKVEPIEVPGGDETKIGYARVSTKEQILDLQIAALKREGCGLIYHEKRSGAAKYRPVLDLAIKGLREGDTLIVWRIDRLDRTMRGLYDHLDAIAGSDARFRSIQESFDFSTAMGKFVLGVLGLCAELERQITADRTTAGMQTAMAAGKKFGRKPVLDAKKKKRIIGMIRDHNTPNKVIAFRLGCSVSSVQNFLKAERKRRPRKYLNRRRN